GLRNDCPAAAAVDRAPLQAATVDRPERNARSGQRGRVTERFAWWQRQLRNRAILPDHRQPAGAEKCGGGSPYHDAAVVRAARNRVTAPGKIRQPNDAAVECPGKRLTSAGADRSAHCN